MQVVSMAFTILGKFRMAQKSSMNTHHWMTLKAVRRQWVATLRLGTHPPTDLVFSPITFSFPWATEL